MKALVMNCSPVRNGATAEIVNIVSNSLKPRYEVKTICIDDFEIGFCKGCKTCHNTAKCIQRDDVDLVIEQYEWADVIISVSPSYWADIPGQFKAFIDSINHFYGHLEIECYDSLGLCSVGCKEEVGSRKSEIVNFCNII